MSLLGFDALGRLALGQITRGAATTTVLIAAPGSFALTGIPASFKVTITLAPGAFQLTGFAANEPITEPVTAGAFVLTGNDAKLIRTGFDYDFQQGGIGHLLYERERARQLAKITRKAPPPVDLRTAPTFKPIGSPPVAPAAPVAQLSELQNQRTAALASAAATRKRRQAEAVLLLAS